MTPEQFDTALEQAARNVSLGNLCGFGGRGSGKVFANLPAALRALYLRWQIPVALLASRSPGELVRSYARDCGIKVDADLAQIEAGANDSPHRNHE